VPRAHWRVHLAVTATRKRRTSMMRSIAWCAAARAFAQVPRIGRQPPETL
jgi:hypothetical protein